VNRSELLQKGQQAGTPLYLYEVARVREEARNLRSALPVGARLLYSLKANPLPPVVAAALDAGCGAEVSSPGELSCAVAAGADPATVLYTGPGKSRAEIDTAVSRGARLFSCESPAELDRLSASARAADCELRVLLRLQPPTRAASGLSMADGRQFGFEPEEAVESWRTAGPGLVLDGFHVYAGSQLGTVEHLLEGFGHARDVIDMVAEKTGTEPTVMDLGGGFPWPYATAGEGPALTGLREGLATLLGDTTRELWFETGRRITAAAGDLLLTVVDVKPRGDGVIVVADGGINVLGGMSGLGRVLRLTASAENLSAPDDREQVEAALVGPLCTPLDRLATRVTLRRPNPGDILRIPNVGAYGATASLLAFLTRPAPLELVTDSGAETGRWPTGTHPALRDR
jgi:diaminopimelate decarboxylase